MIISLYMAITIDGFIATHKDDSSWVSDIDWPEFQEFIKQQDAIIMGKKTYEKGIEEKVFPYDGAINIVVSFSLKSNEAFPENNVLFLNANLNEVFKILKTKNINKLGIIGGGKFNGSMLKENYIDEVFLDIHPIIMGDGIKLFETGENIKNLKLLEIKKLDGGQILLHYKVIKNK